MKFMDKYDGEGEPKKNNGGKTSKPRRPKRRNGKGAGEPVAAAPQKRRRGKQPES